MTKEKFEREIKLEKIVLSLVDKVRRLQDKHGHEYVGGMPFQFIVHEIEKLGMEL